MYSFVKMMLDKTKPIMDKWTHEQTSKVPFPADVEVITDIPYMNDGKRCHLIDTYRPCNAAGPLPVIVNFHGGGMVLATKEVNRAFCGQLAHRGFLVFCVDYPLVPDTDVPGIIRDISRGMDRAWELIPAYNGDPERIFVTGDSAGAILAVYAVAAQRNPELASAVPVEPTKLPVKAMGLICGMFCTTAPDNNCMLLRQDFYGKNWRNHPMHKFYDPGYSGICAYLPPCFVVSSKADKLHSYTVKFVRGLRKAGTDFRLLDYPKIKNLPHDFAVYMLDKPETQEAIDKMLSFLLYDKYVSY